jgi:methylglyoxal synthase
VGTVRSVYYDQETRPIATLGLIAGGSMNTGLVHLVRCYGSLLDGCRLVASRTTGEPLLRLGFDVELVTGGPLGANVDIGARVFDRSIDGLIFLPDCAYANHDVDVQMVVRACEAQEVPVATSLASARYLLLSLAHRIKRVRETRALHPAGDR